MLRPLACFALIALAACGSDATDVADPADLRLEIVSGDGQVDTVAAQEQSAAVASVQPVAILDGLEIMPEPLKARLTDAGEPITVGNVSGSLVPSGPSFAALPADVLIGWHTTPAGCGAPFHATTQPDDSANTTNFWVKPTQAGECKFVGTVIVNDTPYVAVEFTGTFAPGPLSRWRAAWPDGEDPYVMLGDSIDIRTLLYGPPGTHAYAYDAHDNAIPLDSLRARSGSSIGAAWHERLGGSTVLRPDTATDIGWWIHTRDFAADGYTLLQHAPVDGDTVDYYSVGLDVWIDGVQSSERVALEVWVP